MAVVNVSYKRCTCDICGKQRDISQALILPNDWITLKNGANKMDCCNECRDLIEDIIDYRIQRVMRGEIPYECMDRC